MKNIRKCSVIFIYYIKMQFQFFKRNISKIVFCGSQNFQNIIIFPILFENSSHIKYHCGCIKSKTTN